MINFQGKTVLITGASRGIGRAISLLFSNLGADLILSSQSLKCQEFAQEIRAMGKKALAIQADVAKSEDVEKMFQEAFKNVANIDILINNAGITRDNISIKLSEDDWDQVLNINLKGAFLCSKEAIRNIIKKRSGVIINIASIVGITGNSGQANYAASKAGLIAMTKSMALEFASRKIRVNAVAPGFIETDMTSFMSEENKTIIEKRIPLKLFGKGEDVANTVAFLSSDLATYITGQTFIVDGGLSL